MSANLGSVPLVQPILKVSDVRSEHNLRKGLNFTYKSKTSLTLDPHGFKAKTPACKSKDNLLTTYQHENIWLRRNVLVSRGRSDFLTLHFKAWKKH